MQLILKIQENLAVTQLAIERNRKLLPYAITHYYLSDCLTKFPTIEVLNQQIKRAEERLDWFKPLLEEPCLDQIMSIENILIESRGIFSDASYYQLQKQWSWAINQIGDLAQCQELVHRLATRLQWLLNSWPSLLSIYQLIEETIDADKEQKYRNMLEEFPTYWEVFWSLFPDLENLDADFELRNLLQKIIEFKTKLEVNA